MGWLPQHRYPGETGDCVLEQLETLAKALLEYETLSGDEIKTLIAGGAIDRGGQKGPTIPAAGSSIPKAKRPKSGIGGPATAGA